VAPVDLAGRDDSTADVGPCRSLTIWLWLKWHLKRGPIRSIHWITGLAPRALCKPKVGGGVVLRSRPAVWSNRYSDRVVLVRAVCFRAALSIQVKVAWHGSASA